MADDMDVDMAPPVKKEKPEPTVGKDGGKQRFEVKKVCYPAAFDLSAVLNWVC